MHLGFAFDSSEQLRLSLQPVSNLMSWLRTLFLINRVGSASHLFRRWRKSHFSFAKVHRATSTQDAGRYLVLGKFILFHILRIAGYKYQSHLLEHRRAKRNPKIAPTPTPMAMALYGCSCTAASVAFAPATALSRTVPAISLARSSAAARRFRASPTFSPATSAVAVINACASSANCPRSFLTACVSLFIIFTFVCSHFSAVYFLRRPDARLLVKWPLAKLNFFHQTDSARILWRADRESICHPRRGNIHRCRGRATFPSTNCRRRRNAASWLPAANG
jgi:hypothetical protein